MNWNWVPSTKHNMPMKWNPVKLWGANSQDPSWDVVVGVQALEPDSPSADSQFTMSVDKSELLNFALYFSINWGEKEHPYPDAFVRTEWVLCVKVPRTRPATKEVTHGCLLSTKHVALNWCNTVRNSGIFLTLSSEPLHLLMVPLLWYIS